MIVAIGVDVATGAGRVHPGVRVGPVDVGGLSLKEATDVIGSAVASASAEPVSLAVGGDEWEITSEQIGLSVDATGMAEAAYAVGRGGFRDVVVDRIAAWLGRARLPLDLAIDDAALEATLDSVREAVATPATDASVEIDGVSVEIVPAADGLDLDPSVARVELPNAFFTDERLVTLDLVVSSPTIGEDGARRAYEQAKKMLSGPVTLTYGDKRWEVPAPTIGEWIAFRAAETSAGVSALEAYIASEEISATVLPMVAEVGRPARDASFKAGGGKVSIVPAQDGLSADAADLAVRLTSVLLSDGERVAELTMRRVEPAISTAMAEGMGIVERISTFTTQYSSSNKSRVNNIHMLADALNGTLVAPDAVFSFNGTIGPRTAEKGYQEANAIVNGKLVPQLGGGICQVGTTIFNTVFFSGLPVVDRRNHSHYISAYPDGRDATISWGGPDFKFKNDTDNWVLIATSYTNSSVTVSLYGTSPGYKVTYETGPWTSVIAPPVREVKDATLPAGTKVIEERGISGRTIVVTRVVTNGSTTVRSDTFKSVYRPVEEVVRVGTKPSVSQPATSAP
jgi:vancomycin resistance protein YoaR